MGAAECIRSAGPPGSCSRQRIDCFCCCNPGLDLGATKSSAPTKFHHELHDDATNDQLGPEAFALGSIALRSEVYNVNLSHVRYCPGVGSSDRPVLSV